MNYYKARMYSPKLGRFMQTDPIGYEDNVNLYGYVGNDPVNGVDPTGLQVIPVDEEARGALNEAAADPNSTITETDALATEAGVPVYVQTGGTDASGDKVHGANTEGPVRARGADGKPTNAIVITIDTRDKPVMTGTNTETGEPSLHSPSVTETLEHELGIDSHTANRIRAGPSLIEPSAEHDRSVQGADRYRQKSAIPFRRGTHTPPHSSSVFVD